MGNICRSPIAEGVFRDILRRHASELEVNLDSAGTHAYHLGESPDPRAQQAAERLGRHVRYVHCKGVSTDISGKCHARVPSDKDLCEWSTMFRHFPKDVMRAIEYPLQPTPPLAQDDMRHADLRYPLSDLPSITRREVERLRAITTTR